MTIVAYDNNFLTDVTISMIKWVSREVNALRLIGIVSWSADLRF